MFQLSPIPVPDLSGRTVLVTGAGRGIGAVLAGVLAAHGAKVFAGLNCPVDPADAGHLRDVETLSLDVTDQRSVDAAIARVGAASGKLDVLVNNAGIITPIAHLASIDSDRLAPAFDVNVIGLHRMIVAALPLLRASRGAIVNAGTGAATTPMEGWTAYCCSKAAARMMTRMCALEFAPDGVQSFFIGIPPTDTPMQGMIREAGLNPISEIPQSDLVPPQVAASVMAWLCGPAARDLDEAILDVRDRLFTAMMTPAAGQSER